jgi:hypothetical protein
MTRTSAQLFLLLTLSPLGLFGCMVTDMLAGDKGQSQSGDDEAETPEIPEDSPPYDRDDTEGTCHGWKYAYCEAIAACDAFSSREQCELDIGYVICREDAPLAECEAAIDAAVKAKKCSELPPECGPSTIADRTIPSMLCEDVHEAICEYGLYCGLELSMEGCLNSLARTEPCDSFTAAWPGAYECADAYSMLQCGGAMPDVCVGSLRY